VDQRVQVDADAGYDGVLVVEVFINVVQEMFRSQFLDVVLGQEHRVAQSVPVRRLVGQIQNSLLRRQGEQFVFDALQVVGQLPRFKRLVRDGLDVVSEAADQVVLVRFDGVRDGLPVGSHVIVGAQVAEVAYDRECGRRFGAETRRAADQVRDSRVFRVFVSRSGQESHRHPSDLGRIIGNGHHQRVVGQFFRLHLRTFDGQGCGRRLVGVTPFGDVVHNWSLQR